MGLGIRRSDGREPSGGTLGRSTSSLRGAWYADPFERADERWWDGRSWTDRVRDASDAGGARPEAHTVRIAGSTRAAPATSLTEEGEESQPAFLPMEVALG